MDFVVAAGLTVGLLAGLWTYVSLAGSMVTWAAFLSWASFYAVGGKLPGLKMALCANVSGAIWGFLILQGATFLAPAIGQTAAFSLAVAVGAAFMCWQAKIPCLGFIPGAFLGCAGFFGTNFNLPAVLIALVLGAVCGYLSEWAALRIVKKADTQNIKA
jgi:hypothetical protein